MPERKIPMQKALIHRYDNKADILEERKNGVRSKGRKASPRPRLRTPKVFASGSFRPPRGQAEQSI